MVFVACVLYLVDRDLAVGTVVCDLPEVVVAKEGPVDDVEQDEAGGEEPAREAVHEHGLLALLLHHVPDLLLPLQLHVVHQALDALLVYHTVSRRCRCRRRRARAPRRGRRRCRGRRRRRRRGRGRPQALRLQL